MTVLFCDADVVTLPDGKTVELNDGVITCDVGITVVLKLGMTVLFCDGDVVTLPDGKTVELNE